MLIDRLRFTRGLKKIPPIFALGLAISAPAEPAATKKNRIRFAGSVAPSYGDNALKICDNFAPICPGAEREGYFLRTSLDFDYLHRFSSRTRFFLEIEGDGDFYEQNLSNADEWSFHLRLGTRFTPYRSGKRRFRLTPEFRYRRRNRSFFSHRTSIEFDGLEDRFNYQLTMLH